MNEEEKDWRGGGDGVDDDDVGADYYCYCVVKDDEFVVDDGDADCPKVSGTRGCLEMVKGVLLKDDGKEEIYWERLPNLGQVETPPAKFRKIFLNGFRMGGRRLPLTKKELLQGISVDFDA